MAGTNTQTLSDVARQFVASRSQPSAAMPGKPDNQQAARALAEARAALGRFIAAEQDPQDKQAAVRALGLLRQLGN